MIPVVDRIRPEYLKMAYGFPELAGWFGCTLPPDAHRDLLDFTLALECVDRHVDATPEPTARLALERAILARELTALPDELARRVERLHRIAPPALWTTAARALRNAERIRTARDAREYVRCVEEEGRLLVDMLLALVGQWCSPALIGFLRGVAELANLADKLIDAHGDYARGELALRPGLALHARLAFAFLGRLPAALRTHPSARRFVRWGLGYLVTMIRSQSVQAGSRMAR